MAIVQISRITHRKGNQENLPQLAGAELGWCVDSRRLFIGNGTLEEGAPVIGNTEILTEYSDLVGENILYTYKDSVVGYTVVTGPNDTAIQRTLQAKLDDMASVRDFGAVGDGVTDDTDAINRALYELYCREINTEIRRSLFFPAGTYRVTDTILIPPYARLVGEGSNSSVIDLTMTDDLSTTASYVARTTDNLQQQGVNIGNNGATPPTNIEIQSLGFSTTQPVDVFLVDRAQNMSLADCSFTGPLVEADLTSASDNLYCVATDSTSSLSLDNIRFDKCSFSGSTYVMRLNTPSNSFIYDACDIDTFYQAFVVGDAPVSGGPRGVRILNSTFDNIAQEVITFDNSSYNVSSNNLFLNECANDFNGPGFPAASIIVFGSDDNISVGDMFLRDDTDAATWPRIELNNTASIGFTSGKEIRLGTYRRQSGLQAQLDDNTVSPTAIFTIDSAEITSFIMDYAVTRDTAIRTGSFRVTANSANGVSYDETYNENAVSGITLSASISGNTVSVSYTASSTGLDALIKYSIERLG